MRPNRALNFSTIGCQLNDASHRGNQEPKRVEFQWIDRVRGDLVDLVKMNQLRDDVAAAAPRRIGQRKGWCASVQDGEDQPGVVHGDPGSAGSWINGHDDPPLAEANDRLGHQRAG